MAEEDLIFGKNRHLFGGLEPSNMKKFVASLNSGDKIQIEAELPDDTVIDGQKLCTVAGAVIRRINFSGMTYPATEFDYEFVADIKTSCTFTDITADPSKVYKYAAFPYSTQGVYNRNKKNRTSFEAPVCSPMVQFTAVKTPGAPSVTITAKLPSDAVRCEIRRMTDEGGLWDETYGDVVKTITSDSTFVDTNVQAGVTYYYVAWPYNKFGVTSWNGANQQTVTINAYEYLYGYDINLADSNPATRVSYPSDVDNYGFSPAYMHYLDSTFDYGSWPRTPGEKFMPRPCMLYNIDAGSSLDGTVAYYLNPDNYTMKADGTASDVENIGYLGNAMMEWPKIYTKRWEENGVYHFRCSDAKLDPDYECWCNYDINNNEIDHFYTAIYNSFNRNGRLASLSIRSRFDSQMADTEITYAEENGPDWYTEVLSDRLLITDLLVMMARSTNCQEAYGTGVCSGNSINYPGSMDDNGLFYGENDQGSGVKVFGMENYWGNVKRRVAGWILAEGRQKVKLTRGTKDGSWTNDYNLDGTGYMTIEPFSASPSGNGYINATLTKPYGRFPIGTTGSASSYEADKLSYNNTGSYYAVVSGTHFNQEGCGPFYTEFTLKADDKISTIVTSLSCKPSKK